MKVKSSKAYTEEQIDFLKKELATKTCSKVSDSFFEKYNRRLTINNLNQIKFKYKIEKNKYYDSKFTDEQKEYLMKYLQYHNNMEAIEMLKNKYSLEVKDSTLKNFRHWYHIKRKYKHHSENYGKPIKKDLYNEIQDSHHGTMVRIETRKYQCKRRYLWEKYHNKKIPKGYDVIFLDGDKNNYDINNLKLVKSIVRIYALKKGIDLSNKDIINTTKLCFILDRKIKQKMKGDE